MSRLKLRMSLTTEVERDAVEALRDAAGQHLSKHLQDAPTGLSGRDREGRPTDLWTAKLLLECAKLVLETEGRRK